MIYLVMGGVVYEGHWVVSAFKSKKQGRRLRIIFGTR